MNIHIIEKFFTDNDNHLVINLINNRILAFYIYLIKIFANKYQSEIINKNIYEIETSNPDLFNVNQKIYLIETSSTKDIKHLMKLNKKIIIFTDYKNYKAYSNNVLSINSYNYEEDINFLVQKIYGINNNILVKNIISHPEYCYSEIEKFKTNDINYPNLEVYDNNDSNNIALTRKEIYQFKKNNELIKLFNLLKLEALNKKFSFLAY